MSNLKVCVPKFLPIRVQGDAVRVAIEENPDNFAPMFTFATGSHPRAAMQTGKRWANGRTLTVSFLSGTAKQQALVKPYFNEWSKYANIKFEFIDKNGELRVAFDQNDGSWSYLGTDALLVPRANPTINFGWLTETSPEQEVRRVVLHEVGHALGLEHELQQPGAGVQWDVNRVVAYFVGPPNYWTREDVYHNIINRISPEGVEYTSFDPESIMAYAVPPAWTKNGVGVPFNTKLSPRDIEFITKMYPKSVTTPPVTGPITIDPMFSLLPPNKYIEGNINFIDNVNEYRVVISEPGKYRFWTSYVGGPVSIIHPSDPSNPVVTGIQQVTTRLMPGEYILYVKLANRSAVYRIKYRKVL